MRLARRVLLWIIFAVVLGLLIALVALPKVMGWVPLAVLSGSMEPTIPTGSQIVVERVESDEDIAEIALGDVITFLPHPGDPTLVTHRVVQVHQHSDGSTSFTTRGDNNDADDPERVAAKQVRGTLLYHVPWMGHLTTAIGNHQKSVAVVAIAVGLLAFAVWQLSSGVSGRKPTGRHRKGADSTVESDGEAVLPADRSAGSRE